MSTAASTSPHRAAVRPAESDLQEPVFLSAQWAEAWARILERVATHFPRAETRKHAGTYLRGLLGPVERKNSWQLAEAVGEPTPYALQHLLGRAPWDADAVRDDVRSYVVEHLGDPSGVLVIDETGFVKKGEHSVGVQRQYSGTAGRIENCQVGVFLAYATARGHTFLDRVLYLPESWVSDTTRCAEAKVPVDVTFATKPQLAQGMLQRALETKVPAAWVVGDEVYGNDVKLRRWLEARSQPYVLAVRCDHYVWYEDRRQTVGELAAALPAREWHRLSAGNGAKGPRLYDWAYVHFPGAQPCNWQRGILTRRSLQDRDEVAYYSVFARGSTTMEAIIQAAATRWTIEECFESAKGEVGLDPYEVRSWHGWHRHITLVMWAHAFLTVQRAAAVTAPTEKKAFEPGPYAHPSDGRGSASPSVVAALECTAPSR